MTRRARLTSVLDRLGFGATLLLPVFLTHGRLFSEIMMDLLAIGLLARSALGLGWGWGRQFWVRVALLWWGWQIVCSLPHIGIGSSQALTQSILAIRFPLMAAALQVWTLRDEPSRTTMRWVLITCCGYFVLQFLVQAIFGHNLFGYPRYIDGTLTGPYAHPRAAAPFSRLVLPVMMLGCAWLMARPGKAPATGSPGTRNGNPHRTTLPVFLAMSGLAVIVLGIMVLAGQRIPMALTALGIGICALFYRPLRPAALVGALSLPVLVLLVRVLAPQAFQHLIVLAAHQLSHFWESHYGLLFTRAIVIAQAHPVTGLGYDAFRHACANPAYLHGLSWLSTASDGGGTSICVQHAHNHYLQALTNAGLPGLFLFGGLVFACLRALWPVQGAHHAWRIGLFAAFFVQEWPFASASDFLNLPLGGWAFMLLGVGLAEAAALGAPTLGATSVPRDKATLYAVPTVTSR
ncbi:O-antigen ligase family protein [Asaia sp. As-1742]|uniref:O-antigen ligase family protein n=1 Tax=Asaia sp. As-1742 TaxID=2608325 RepID=UPI00142497C9|nr:O-antigen ligase family protein [Asaia sp. As-1742]NIE80116.1 O-antigen ligase family protein [Asaia sp. As-1742]